MTDLSSKDRATAAARMIFRRKIAPAGRSGASFRPRRFGPGATFAATLTPLDGIAAG
jgi:hypothetical protein